MQVHGDHMVHAGDREEIGEHTGRDGTAMTLLLRLARVGEVSRLSQHSLWIEVKQDGQHTA